MQHNRQQFEQKYSRNNPITGEAYHPEEEEVVRKPSHNYENPAASYGRGKNSEVGERSVKQEKQRAYKEELDRWVEEQRVHKGQDTKPKRSGPPAHDSYPMGGQENRGESYIMALEDKGQRQMQEAFDRREKQKALLEGYKEAIEAKRKLKSQEKEKDKVYQQQQFEEIVKQDRQREDHFKMLKGERLPQGKSHEVIDYNDAQAYEGRYPPIDQQEGYRAGAKGEAYDIPSNYDEEALRREYEEAMIRQAMAEKAFNREKEPAYVPQQKKPQQPIQQIYERPPVNEYQRIRQKNGNHSGGFNIINHLAA